MSQPVRLVLAIHNHQPVGNFDDVMEASHQDSYAPFLDILREYPEIPISLHISGSLLEWQTAAHPEYIERVRDLVDQGRIEILGGAFYEPILGNIPRRDRLGQIRQYSQHLEQMFRTHVRGMWVPERVWEPSFAGDIVAAGIEYTVLDDFHFRCAGFTGDELHGYFSTEDEGRLLMVFPGSERLRYTIPFADPQETIDYLGEIHSRFPGSVIVFGDDGEKFGTWPGTKDHCYRDGWLRRFFEALRSNPGWIRVTTLSEAVNNVAPVGRCYLPDCSYREMTEWALPTERQREYTRLSHREDVDVEWQALLSFARGGFWRNFRVKYPESNEMYARMMEISRRIRERSRQEQAPHVEALLSEATTELYRGQCNCAYWHGASGGLYLPHLRHAVYRHLISADNLLESVESGDEPRVTLDAGDFNLDARKEVRLSSHRLVAYLAPARGGHLYELDVRGLQLNLLGTLNRRVESYHDKVREAAAQNATDGNGVESIHDLVRFKQPDLDKKLQYDAWPRKSLVDHFLQSGLSLHAFQHGRGLIGDFAEGVYSTVLRPGRRRVEVELSRVGSIGEQHTARVIKTIALDLDSSGSLSAVYEIRELPPGVPVHFAVEFNFAGIPGGADDRYFYDAAGRKAGAVDSLNSLDDVLRIGLIDEWQGLDASLEFSKRAAVWTMPIQTVSQSEGGFELVHQSCSVVPRWEFVAPQDGCWHVEITMDLDTSVAQARQLSEAAVSG